MVAADSAPRTLDVSGCADYSRCMDGYAWFLVAVVALQLAVLWLSGRPAPPRDDGPAADPALTEAIGELARDYSRVRRFY